MRSIASLIQEMMSSQGVIPSSPVSLMRKAWPLVVGDDLAVLTRIRGLEEDILVVESLHPAAMLEIRSREGEFSGKLNAATGVPLRAIRVRPAGRRI